MKFQIIARENICIVNHQYDDEALYALDAIRIGPVFEAESQYEAAKRIDEFSVYWTTLRNPDINVRMVE